MRVFVAGTRPDGVMRCHFGQESVINVTALQVSDSEVMCQVPAGSKGVVFVAVSAGAEMSSGEVTFEYRTSVVVLGVVPSHGNGAGGTRVQVVGRGFQLGDGMCKIG